MDLLLWRRKCTSSSTGNLFLWCVVRQPLCAGLTNPWLCSLWRCLCARPQAKSGKPGCTWTKPPWPTTFTSCGAAAFVCSRRASQKWRPSMVASIGLWKHNATVCGSHEAGTYPEPYEQQPCWPALWRPSWSCPWTGGWTQFICMYFQHLVVRWGTWKLPLQLCSPQKVRLTFKHQNLLGDMSNPSVFQPACPRIIKIIMFSHSPQFRDLKAWIPYLEDHPRTRIRGYQPWWS